jgi:hypothetical protein
MKSQPPTGEEQYKEAMEESAKTASDLTDKTMGKIARANQSSLEKIKEQPWQEWIDLVFDFLAKIPEQVGAFFSGYRQPLVTLLLIISGIVTVYITLAVLDAIDDIPLLAPVLELVGLGYTAWFIYRYLWKAENRQELIKEFEAFKSQVVGRNSQDS